MRRRARTSTSATSNVGVIPSPREVAVRCLCPQRPRVTPYASTEELAAEPLVAARSGGVEAMDDPITAQIAREVAGWDGVTMQPHRFGGIEFLVGRRR